MKHQTTYFWIFFCAAGVSTLSWARNDGFSRDSGDRTSGWGTPSRSASQTVSDAPRTVAAPSVGRSFTSSQSASRSVPPVTYTPRTFQAPAVQSAPAVRSDTPVYSGRTPSFTPPQVPVYTAPRVSADSTPRTQTVSPTRELPTLPIQPTRSVATPNIQVPDRVQAPAVQRTLPDIQTVTPRFTPQTESARSFGTARTPPASAETPVVTAPASSRTLPDRGSLGLSRPDLNISRETGHISEPARHVTAESEPSAIRTTPRWQPSTRTTATTRDTTAGIAPSQRLNAGDFRLDSRTLPNTVSPMRFGSTGVRSPTSSHGDAAALPSAFSLRSPRGDADTDRFGRAALPRVAIPTIARDTHPSGGQPSRFSGNRFGDNNALYRPPYGAMGENHQPFHAQHPPFNNHRPPDYYHHDGHHDDDHHHDHHHPYYWGYSPYAFSPVWWGPVVYPAGFGLTWYSGSFALSVATYEPAYCYTRYYDSWHGGGWGYTSVYYGGWRSGWYGGFSYVYNPWPAYRTYYFYDPYPVTETVYVTQPASTTVYVTQPSTTTVVTEPAAATTSYAAAPAGYAAASVPAASAPAPASSYASSWESAPAVQRSEAAVTTCFCPCKCNGMRPCICDYPCGSEYALRDEDFDLGLAFSSYADTLSTESIWSSYAGLDRWDTHAADDSATVATAGGDAR